jgi:hypothetical protein
MDRPYFSSVDLALLANCVVRERSAVAEASATGNLDADLDFYTKRLERLEELLVKINRLGLGLQAEGL